MDNQTHSTRREEMLQKMRQHIDEAERMASLCHTIVLRLRYIMDLMPTASHDQSAMLSACFRAYEVNWLSLESDRAEAMQLLYSYHDLDEELRSISSRS